MPSSKFDTLLEWIAVRLEAFAMCEIDRGCSLDCPPTGSILVHFVLEGEGVLECEHGRYALRPGRVVIVPRNMPKRLEGPGPIVRVVGAAEACQLSAGLAEFHASGAGEPGIVLGCGSVSIDLAGAPGPFDHLDRPLVEDCDEGPLPLLFHAMSAELRRPTAGTKALIEALMKQIIVVVLRGHFARDLSQSPLRLVPTNPNLGRAIAAILASPAELHSLATLATLAGMSRSAFSRHFSSSYDCTPMEFVQNVRLRAAARLLARSDMPVKSIAAAVGYASRSHFSRAFTAQFGSDPSRYRGGSRHPSEGRATREPELVEDQLIYAV